MGECRCRHKCSSRLLTLFSCFILSGPLIKHPWFCLPQADRKQNKIKQSRRKETRGQKDCLTLITWLQGRSQEKRLENVLNSPLASGKAFLHITRLSPEPTNVLYPMASSKVAWIIRILGDGNSVVEKSTN